MTSIAFEWETVKVNRSKNNGRRKSQVYITTGGSKNSRLNRLNISADLVEQLKWEDGERVNLKRSKGGTMFALCKDKVGLITLKKAGNSLYHQNYLLVAELNTDKNGTEFTAWVDGDDLIFRSESA